MRFQQALDRLREIAETLPDDDPDKLEMLNTEGDFDKLIEWALSKRNECTVKAEGCKTLSDLYAGRKKSFEARADGMKEIVGLIMRCANETKYQGSAGTVSIGQKAQGVIVTDETKIPERFFKTEKKLMKAELNKAVLDGEAIDGAALDNGGEQINIRSK